MAIRELLEIVGIQVDKSEITIYGVPLADVPLAEETRSMCKVCGKLVLIMILRNCDWCCENHRKILQGEK